MSSTELSIQQRWSILMLPRLVERERGTHSCRSAPKLLRRKGSSDRNVLSRKALRRLSNDSFSKYCNDGFAEPGCRSHRRWHHERYTRSHAEGTRSQAEDRNPRSAGQRGAGKL